VIVALALVTVALAFVLIWYGHDVRAVLLAAALAIGAMSGQAGAVFRRTAEALGDIKFVLPICSAMGFAFVVRETGCADALVSMLLRPIGRAPRVAVPGSSFVSLVVNMALPSQTSTLAATGPLAVPLLARVLAPAALAGSALVLGASIAGALMNPGLAEIATAARAASLDAPALVVRLAPGVLIAFAVGIATLLLLRRAGGAGGETLAASVAAAAAGSGSKPREQAALKAVLAPLPIVWLLLGHPSLPWHAFMQRATLKGLEVFTAMIGGAVVVIALAAADRKHAIRALFDGMGYAFANVITIIAVSVGTAKALEVAGVLKAFVSVAAGGGMLALAAAFLLAFGLAVVTGSGTASSVALITALSPRAQELGVPVLPLCAVILFAAEAGRTTSPVAAVLLFGSNLTSVPPRALATNLVLPCLFGGAAGAAAIALST
jgi:DcuC family C4-dicarboxylate transporter